jgi:hypothetical protein
MKRIISVIGLALVIGALAAPSALACVVSGVAVFAPNHGQKGNGGNSGDNAPSRHFITCIPETQGTTDQAAPNAPAVQLGCPD